MESSYLVYLFTYQSQETSFPEWINLITLCLAPLLAHILIGAPEPVIVAETRPPWSDRFCQYNPTSIIWRYFAIVDRRTRTKSWKRGHLVAANLILWTNSGWYTPDEIELTNAANVDTTVKSHISLFSSSSLKTVMVALQGIQAVYILVTGMRAETGFFITIGSTFIGIAVLGLLRLPAAPWILDDAGYAQVSARLIQQYALGDEALGDTTVAKGKLGVWGICVRFYYLVQIVGLLIVAFFYAIPYPLAPGRNIDTASNLTARVFYLFLLGGTSTTMLWYIARGRTKSTVIPCLHSFWYKSYTFILSLLGLALIVISALETARLPNGHYTTFPLRLFTSEE